MGSQSKNEKAGIRGTTPFPDELLSFFESEQGRVLLVRGDPGTGKTLFAVQALNILRQDGGEVLYVSTRADVDTVYQQCMVDKTALSRRNIFDVSQSTPNESITPTEGLENNEFGPKSFLKWLRTLGEVSNPLTVVFDSWELVQQSIQPYASQNEAAQSGNLIARLVALVRQHGLRVILVTEQAEQTNLDYAADGAVELRAGHATAGRPERMLLLQKLRGVRIANRTRPYTLLDGSFQTYLPVDLPPSEPSQNEKGWTRISNTNSKFSTGITDLDKILDGGYSRGSIVHFELGPDLPRDTWSLSCIATARNFLSHKMGVAVVPLLESSPGLVRQRLEPVLGDHSFQEYCNVFETYGHKSIHGTEVSNDTVTDESDGSQNIEVGGRFNYSDYLTDVERLRERSTGPLLHIISLDAVGEGVSRILNDHTAYVALHNDLSIFVTKQENQQRAEANRIADIHLRLERRGETVFLYGENPVTPFLGFDTQTGGVGSDITLEEMV
jgi:KaiC/GvpD/RAD55 family RecA-like ATPase